MMKNRIFIRLVVAIAVLISFLITFYFYNRKTFKDIRINNAKVRVEIADTTEKIVKGLSKRKSLKPDEGMLFIYSDKGERTFWMKDMRFPIDIVWVEGDKIIGIDKNIPQGGEKEKRVSPRETDKVLEVNAGFCDRNGISIGDIVRI